MKNLILLAFLLLAIAPISAQHFFTGYLYNLEGEAIPGVTVSVVGQESVVTSTDKGSFRISVPGGQPQIVRFEHIAYETLNYDISFPENGSLVYSLDFFISKKLVELDPISVTGNRVETKSPVTHVNLNKKTIERMDFGLDVPFLLDQTPSAVVSSDAGTGMGYTGIRIRGSDPTRINVTLNGIPLNDSESQGVYWVDLPDFAGSTNSIQVQRGVGASTNGAGAFGGSINLKTTGTTSKPYGEIHGGVGSYNTLRSSLRFGTGLIDKKYTFDGRLSYLSSDGYIDRATATLNGFYASAAYLGKKTSASINLFGGHEITYQAWGGVPSEYLNDLALRTYNPYEYDQEVDDYRQTHSQLHLTHQLDEQWKANAAIHYTKGKGFFEQFKEDETLADYGLQDVLVGSTTITESDLIRRRWLDNDFYGLTASLVNQTKNLKTTLGGAWNNYEGSHFGEVIWAEYFSTGNIRHRYYDNFAEKSDFNIFSKMDWQTSSKVLLMLDLQYRQLNYAFTGLDAAANPLDDEIILNFFNPKAGAQYQINPQSRAYIYYGIAHKEPNRNDYTETSPLTRPKPERLGNLEFGYTWSSDDIELVANFFRMDYKDQLVLNGKINDVGEYSRVNVDKSHRMGVELSSQFRPLNILQWNATAAISQNRVDEFEEYIDNWDLGGQDTVYHFDSDLSFSPSAIFSSELVIDLLKGHYGIVRKSGKTHRLSAGLVTKFVGRQFIDNTSNENRQIDPFTVNNLELHYSIKKWFGKEIVLKGTLRNVFNELYETNAWVYPYVLGGEVQKFDGYFPQATRNFLLSAAIKF